jgi:hypothetical protein
MAEGEQREFDAVLLADRCLHQASMTNRLDGRKGRSAESVRVGTRLRA